MPGPKLDVPPMLERLPRREEIVHPPHQVRDDLDETRKNMIAQRQQRLDEFIAEKQKWYNRRAEDSKARSAKNKEDAADVRRRFLASLEE